MYAWMRGNLTTQGYRLGEAERRRLWLGLTATNPCLPSEALTWRERRTTREEAIAA